MYYLESIHIQNGIARHAAYHTRRMITTLQSTPPWITGDPQHFLHNLFLHACPTPQPDTVYKLRLIYHTQGIVESEAVKYTIKPVTHLQLLPLPPHFDYSRKYAQRQPLTLLQQQTQPAEPLLLQHGFLTDTTYTNVCLLQQGIWYTPSHYLLNGTMRQWGLDTGAWLERPIPVHHLTHYTHIALINAMLPLGALVLPIEAIQ